MTVLVCSTISLNSIILGFEVFVKLLICFKQKFMNLVMEIKQSFIWIKG